MDEYELKFQQVYDEYHIRIFRYLTRMVGEGAAEDLTQEVFVKIGRGLQTFRGESQLSTWIYQIATNAALDRFRSSHHRQESKIPVDEIAESENDKDIWTGEQRPSTEQRIIKQEMNGCIRNIIDTLPETHRSVIVLSEMEGMKDSEIASILGLSLEATKIRLHRARAKLKNELSKACDFYRNEQNEFACDRKNNGD